jgi:hypothetical protein
MSGQAIRAAECTSAADSRLPRLNAVGENAVMEAEPTKADLPKRKRRWFQFSLRTLLVFTVAVAIGCAWLGRKVEQKRRERTAADTIIKLHGSVYWDYERVKGKPGFWQPGAAQRNGDEQREHRCGYDCGRPFGRSGPHRRQSHRSGHDEQKSRPQPELKSHIGIVAERRGRPQLTVAAHLS